MNEDLMKCSKCEMNSSKFNFYKDISTRDGLNPICKNCGRGYYIKNYEKKSNIKKENNEQNQAKINLYEQKYEKKTNLNFELACKLKSRTNKVLRSQNVEQLNKTFDSVGCSQSIFKRWILY